MTTTIPPSRPRAPQEAAAAAAATTAAADAARRHVEAAGGALDQRWRGRNRTLAASVAFGAALAVDGAARALQTRRTRATLLNAAAALCAVLLLFYVLAQAATLPVRILRRIVWGVTWASTLDASHNNSGALWYFDLAVRYVHKAFFALVLSVPELGLYCVRYYFPGPMDRIFHESLNSYMSEIENPQFRLAAKNASKTIDASFDPKEGNKLWFSNLQAFAGRYASRLKILFFVFLLSFVPVVGFLAWPCATFLYIGDKVNYPTAGLLFALTLVSPRLSKYIRGPLLRTMLELRALARELVDPYISRSKMTHDQKLVWLKKHDAVIIGFTIPFFLLLWVPLVGPALYFALANSCAARLCMELFDKIDFDDSQVVRGPFEPRLGFLQKAAFDQLLIWATSADAFLEVWMSFGYALCSDFLRIVASKLSVYSTSASHIRADVKNE
ncbi:hypothetical protein BDR26DRAFT_1010612 [Obelidium mucronatum]|nr:hypothetical protein BDR26DRAFT_1010612 [Obelidium mucronatum]